MKRWRWALLIFELALLAIILVLPQVDLPDFAIRGGTAPPATWARRHSPPAQPMAMAVLLPLRRSTVITRLQLNEISSAPGPVSRLALLCTLIC